MKKFILVLLVSFLTSSATFAYDFIKENEMIYFNPSSKSWESVQNSNEDITLKNKSFIGSGGFQEYYYNDGKLAIGPEVNVSFIDNGELFGINCHDLKFFKYVYEDNKFKSVLLTEDEIHKLYPDYQIVKISQFKDNSITLDKKFFRKKKVLLLNDTNNSFYKYSYKPHSVNPTYIKQLIEVSHSGTIVFSHYGDDNEIFPALKIHVKNRF